MVYDFQLASEATRSTGLRWSVTTGAARIGSNFVVEVRSRDKWEVSGVPVDPYEGTGYSVVYHVHRIGTFAVRSGVTATIPLDRPGLRHLKPGPQTFKARLIVDAFEKSEDAFKDAAPRDDQSDRALAMDAASRRCRDRGRWVDGGVEVATRAGAALDRACKGATGGRVEFAGTV